MDFLTPSCPICCLYVSDVVGHWRWHQATDRVVMATVPYDQADDFAQVRQAYKEYAEQWAEMDRRRAEQKARDPQS